jgi:hypothetical protein
VTEAREPAIKKLMTAVVKRPAPQIAEQILDADKFTLKKSGRRELAVTVLSDGDFSDELNREPAETLERTRRMREDAVPNKLSTAA